MRPFLVPRRCVRVVAVEPERWGSVAVPLSESVIWDWLPRYHERAGPDAWSNSTVPWFITSNAVVARAYAHTVLGHLQDLHARGALDPAEPVYVVELGTGHGRLTYLLLRRLLRLLRDSPLPPLQLRYVMTDVAESNLTALTAHPLLRELIDAGVLDAARLDCHTSTHLELRGSGLRIGPGDVVNPLVLVANYVFDSLRQDSFRVRGGVLEEGLVRVVGGDAEPDWADPGALEKLELHFEHVPVAAGRYGEPLRDALLEAYRGGLPDTTFGFPTGALGCLDRLRALSPGGLLLLAADRGFVHLDELLGHGEPHPAAHGSFSFMVNFHALGEYVLALGGRVLRPPLRDPTLGVVGLVLGPDGTSPACPATELAFHEYVDGFGPGDYLVLHRALHRVAAELTLPELIAALRVSDHDPQMLRACTEPLITAVADAGPAQHRELSEVLARCWDNYFPMGEPDDLPFEIARLHSRMDQRHDALRFYQYSIDLFGEHHVTLANMARLRQALGDPAAALAALDRSLEMEPGYSPARAARLQLLAGRDTPVPAPPL